MKNIVIGIDISKKTTDWCLVSGTKVVSYHNVENRIGTIEAKLRELIKSMPIDTGDMMVCAEHTGHYTYPLTIASHNVGIDLWLESGYNIKCEARKERGKSAARATRRTPAE